jgi:hypothetical protein
VSNVTGSHRLPQPVLIVDDEADIRMLIAGILEDDGHQTRNAANSTAAPSSTYTKECCTTKEYTDNFSSLSQTVSSNPLGLYTHRA